MLNDSLYSSEKADWATPQKLFDRLNDEFNFTVDVCADQSNHKCLSYFNTESDGLSQEWKGVIWMNPPYGRGIDKWVEKAFESSRTFDCTCVCLVPVRSDTKWWHNFIMKSSEVRLLSKRLSFEGSSNKAPFPVAVVVFSHMSTEPILKPMVV